MAAELRQAVVPFSTPLQRQFAVLSREKKRKGKGNKKMTGRQTVPSPPAAHCKSSLHPKDPLPVISSAIGGHTIASSRSRSPVRVRDRHQLLGRLRAVAL
jgi:hypothetical protein